MTITLTGLFAAAVYFGAGQSWGRLQPVEIRLDQSSPDQILFERIAESLHKRMAKLQGQWLWKVSLDNLMSDILIDSRVQSAHITRLFPNRILITVLPQKPIMGLIGNRDQIYPVAPDGSLLPAADIVQASDWPLLRGRRFLEDESLRKNAIEIYNQLPDRGAFSKQRVSEIMFVERDGFVFRLTQGGVEVKLGDGNLGPKASRIERVLNYLNDQQLQGRVIDARFSKKVVVRLRNAP